MPMSQHIECVSCKTSFSFQIKAISSRKDWKALCICTVKRYGSLKSITDLRWVNYFASPAELPGTKTNCSIWDSKTLRHRSQEIIKKPVHNILGGIVKAVDHRTSTGRKLKRSCLESETFRTVLGINNDTTSKPKILPFKKTPTTVRRRHNRQQNPPSSPQLSKKSCVMSSRRHRNSDYLMNATSDLA